MNYKVIIKDGVKGFKLGSRCFNSLTQATGFIKHDVKTFLKGGFYCLVSEEVGNGLQYRALYLDIYNRARIITWNIEEA